MASSPESHADIVSLMRNKDYYRGYMGPTNPLTDSMVSCIIDRLEAAHRREVDELKAALKSTVTEMCNYCRSTPEAKGLPCLNGCETMLVAKQMLEETK